jgi:hypothetical protein
LGLAGIDGYEVLPHVNSELGGFVVTFVTGGILMAAGAIAGILIRLVIPAR